MGEYAQDVLNQWIKGGMRGGDLPRNKITRAKCPDCGKEVHGRAALMQHENAKHTPKKYTWQKIDAVRIQELYGDEQ